MIENLVSALLKYVDSSVLISLRLLLPQYKRLIKFYNNHFDSRISFIHLVGETTHINRPASTTGHRRKKSSSQSLVQRSLRIPFYEMCGDRVSPTVLYKSDMLNINVTRHVDLQGPTYGANDLSLSQYEPSGDSKYLSPTPRRLVSSSPNLLSLHFNNSGLTLNKVTAIQSAIDDNKSPTFPEIQGTLTPVHEYNKHHNTDHRSLVAYGWVILIGTWVIVILGISSMLGTWDSFFLGVTPPVDSSSYEKETGFPIAGYYPCLIFMTFIASWVWCIISWMGIKFFRHTKGGLTREKSLNT